MGGILIESKQINSLLSKFRENKLAHAFLLETNNEEKCYLDIVTLIKIMNCAETFDLKCQSNCNLCNLIDNNELPSFITIKPDGQVIKKEQILNLMKKFSTKPIFSKYNIYVIKQADRFNSSSANTILKFLEEPEDNIIGFFITNNKENILPTIRSRCQVIKVDYNEIGSLIDDSYLDQVKIYLNAIYKNREDILFNKTNMSGFYEDRKQWEIFFSTMLFYIKECSFGERVDKIELINSINSKKAIDIINLIEQILKYIKANVNIDMILDKFVIEMRKYYE